MCGSGLASDSRLAQRMEMMLEDQPMENVNRAVRRMTKIAQSGVRFGDFTEFGEAFEVCLSVICAVCGLLNDFVWL